MRTCSKRAEVDQYASRVARGGARPAARGLGCTGCGAQPLWALLASSGCGAQRLRAPPCIAWGGVRGGGRATFDASSKARSERRRHPGCARYHTHSLITAPCAAQVRPPASAHRSRTAKGDRHPGGASMDEITLEPEARHALVSQPRLTAPHASCLTALSTIGRSRWTQGRWHMVRGTRARTHARTGAPRALERL